MASYDVEFRICEALHVGVSTPYTSGSPDGASPDDSAAEEEEEEGEEEEEEEEEEEVGPDKSCSPRHPPTTTL
jgi:ribosomal protein L12E/L44/L45/RPP1/RPP2